MSSVYSTLQFKGKFIWCSSEYVQLVKTKEAFKRCAEAGAHLTSDNLIPPKFQQRQGRGFLSVQFTNIFHLKQLFGVVRSQASQCS